MFRLTAGSARSIALRSFAVEQHAFELNIDRQVILWAL
jgi:hypothetical protein